MDDKKLKTTELNIIGMTCGSCELVLERKIGKVQGVVKVSVNHRTGVARITADADSLPSAELVERTVKEAGYGLACSIPSEEQNIAQKGVIKVRIDGMSDKNCERLVKQKLHLVNGVKYVSVHYGSKSANIHYKGAKPLWEDLESAVQSAGFRMRRFGETTPGMETPHQKWMEIGASLLIIFALYEILKAFDVLSFVSNSTAGAATLWGVLIIGLVAGASSCLAVTGGLLLSVAAKYNEIHQSQSPWQKFKPLLYFNAGRLASYFVLGGLVGTLGRSMALSPKTTGYMNILVALVMLWMALSILKIIPKGSLPIRLPKSFSHKIANISESKNPAAPFGLGAMTFFLPCGFTQSLQFVALASGSFFSGSMTMFVFALGTLPALLGISAISSTATGRSSGLFLRFSGVLVLVLALFNLNSGLVLTGVDAKSFIPNFGQNSNTTVTGKPAEDRNVIQNSDGSQTIKLNVTSYGYSPRSFTVFAGKPTTIIARASEDARGCANVLNVPSFGLVKFLEPGSVGELGPFTPKKDFFITCSMGMFFTTVKVI